MLSNITNLNEKYITPTAAQNNNIVRITCFKANQAASSNDELGVLFFRSKLMRNSGVGRVSLDDPSE